MFNVVFLLIITSVQVKSKLLPSYLRDLKCSVTAKDVGACLLRSSNLAIPRIVAGDSEYNIPKMNPLELEFIQLIRTPSLSLNLTKIKVYGLENIRVTDVKFKTKELMFRADFVAKNITIQGEYSVDGKILLLPVRGDGPFSVFMKGGIFSLIKQITAYDRDGEKYIKVTSDNPCDYKFDGITFQFDNLFGGDKKLGEQINTFLNENWDLLLADFGPAAANIVFSKNDEILNQFMSQVPFKDFFEP